MSRWIIRDYRVYSISRVENGFQDRIKDGKFEIAPWGREIKDNVIYQESLLTKLTRVQFVLLLLL